MLNRILACALVAGLAVGLATSVLQTLFVTPLILQAEVFEDAPATAHDHGAGAAVHEHGAEAHDHGEGWSPADGLERIAYTTLATTLASIGFALMLVACATLAPGGLTVRTGIAFGLAGFAATGLATSFGLAPELPGSAAGELGARQLWWVGTAVATAAGVAAIAYGRIPFKALGLVLVALPHLVGAPEAPTPSSTAPAELAAAFVGRTLFVQAVMWVALGAACGWFWTRAERRPAAASLGPASRVAG